MVNVAARASKEEITISSTTESYIEKVVVLLPFFVPVSNDMEDLEQDRVDLFSLDQDGVPRETMQNFFVVENYSSSSSKAAITSGSTKRSSLSTYCVRAASYNLVENDLVIVSFSVDDGDSNADCTSFPSIVSFHMVVTIILDNLVATKNI